MAPLTEPFLSLTDKLNISVNVIDKN